MEFDSRPSDVLSSDMPEPELLENQIQNGKLLFLEEHYRDPVPQCSNDEIAKATKFLKESVVAMQKHLASFELSSLADADEVEIKVLQEKCRKSCTRLVLMLGDRQQQFHGRRAPGPLAHFAERVQSQKVVGQLQSLRDFVQGFCNIQWCGEMCATEEFEAEKRAVSNLLCGLTSPRESPVYWNWFCEEYTIVTEQLLELYFKKSVQACKLEFENGEGDHLRWVAPQQPPLFGAWALSDAQKTQYDTLWPRWWLLQKITCRHLGPSDYSSRPWRYMEDPVVALANGYSQRMQEKMSSLSAFAETFNDFSDILKRYMLVRLGEITMDDVHVRFLKEWITEDEALKIYEMLEEFRDEASYARAVKAASKQTTAVVQARSSEHSLEMAGSPACAKQDLCDQSTGNIGFVEGNTNDEDGHGKGLGRSKRSHRQRQRYQKVWKAMPHTNSSCS